MKGGGDVMRRFLLAPFGVVAVTLGVLAAASSITALGSEPNVISACVNPSSGEMKIVKSGGSCGGDQVLLTWAQIGSQGPMGPAGPAGPAGPSGIAQVQYMFGGIYPDTAVARAFCPAGTKVVGGGGSV
jgi:hypothetical protein